MPKVVLPALLALAMLTGAASAQQRTLYDARGNVLDDIAFHDGAPQLATGLL
jgi:hypothetical protein